MLQIAKNIAKKFLIRIFPAKMGYVIKPKGEGYFDAGSIFKAAKKENLSVVEYLEKYDVGRVGRKRNQIIAALKANGVIKTYERIIEIGAGTGMFLESFIQLCNPKVYEVYETNLGWANYIKKRYNGNINLKVHNPDGYTLKESADKSADIITAHGVFVYLPIVITFQYLKEATRVCKNNGKIVFDCFSDRIFTVEEIIRFRGMNPDYDFPVVIPEKMLSDFCDIFHLAIEASFDMPYHFTQSTYFVLRKK
jgi:ubiquinone/menaquinone biosynthesis C-methylase UbiE